MQKLKKGSINNKAILVNMIWSCLAVIINYLINFLITPYVTNNIGIEAYGFVALANSFTSYIDIISISLNSLAGRYISIAYHKGDKRKANKYYSSTVFADLVLAVGVLIPSIFIIAKLEYILKIPDNLSYDVKLLFLIVVIKYLFSVLRTAFNAATFIRNRLDLSERQQSIAYVLQAVILLACCTILEPHVWYVGLSAAIGALYLLCVNIKLSHRLTPELKFDIKDSSIKDIKEIVSSGIWSSLNSLGNVLNSGLDLLITNLLLTTIVQGQISVAKNLATICYTLVLKISGAYKPKQLKLYAEENIKDLIAIFRRSMGITGFVCNLIICVFVVCGKDFLRLWIPNQDTNYIYTVTVIVLLGDVVIGVVNPLYYIYVLTNKLKLPCLVTIGMGIVNVISMFILIKYTNLGGYAVVLTTMILNWCHFIDTPLYSAFCLNVPLTTFYPPILRHFISLLAGGIVGKILLGLMPGATSWVELIRNGMICAIVIGMLLFIVQLFNFSRKK